MTRRRIDRLRKGLAGLVASFKLIGALTAVLGFMALNGDGGAGGGDGGAGGEGGDGGQGGGDGGAGDGGGDGGQGGGAPAKVTFTKEQQAEIDRIVAERAAKAADKAKKDAIAEAKAEADKAKLDETERLKVEKAEADTKAEAATKAANDRAVKAEAKVAAVAAGVKPDVVTEFLSVVDLSEVTVDDDGEPDAKAIKKAIDATLAKETFKTAFTGGAGKSGSSGGEHSGSGGGEGRAKTLADAVNKRMAGSNA